MGENITKPEVKPIEEGFCIEFTNDEDEAFDLLWSYLRGPDADYSAEEVIRAFAGANVYHGRGYWGGWLEEDGSPVDEEYPVRWFRANPSSRNERDHDVVFIKNGEVW